MNWSEDTKNDIQKLLNNYLKSMNLDFEVIVHNPKELTEQELWNTLKDPVNSNELKVDILLTPVKPVEFIKIDTVVKNENKKDKS